MKLSEDIGETKNTRHKMRQQVSYLVQASIMLAGGQGLEP